MDELALGNRYAQYARFALLMSDRVEMYLIDAIYLQRAPSKII
jgi:hypothetical protein